ncbi:hypothetical protein FRC07_000511 [Ceratobasidium sp. 392]|nr:hypothetical protein FRC07_000511 [Ceratobasidium sp. 392]
MASLHAELSIVSLPPRDLLLAKRRAKAIKRGISPLVVANNLVRQKKRQAKAPAPTLASTRQRRPGRELGYYDQPDGCFQYKRVNRRPPLPPAPVVPYLAGQEDIPHSDAESDVTAPEVAPQGVDVTMRDAGNSKDVDTYNEDEDEDNADAEDNNANDDDDDAEGEDDDILMAAPATFAPHLFVKQPWPQYINIGASPTFSDQSAWNTTLLNLLKDTDPEDLQVLFGSLHNITTSDLNVPTRSAGEPFAMHQLYTAVDNLEATQPLQHIPSHTDDHAMAPPPSVGQFVLPLSGTSSSHYQRVNTRHPAVAITDSQAHNSLGLTLTPARVLPPLLIDLAGTSLEDQVGYDSDIPWPSTPVALDNTDIGLIDRPASAPTSPLSTRHRARPEIPTGPCQAPYPGPSPARRVQSRSSRMLNTRRLHRQFAHRHGTPMLLNLQSNTRKVHTRQRQRPVWNSSQVSNLRPLHIGLRASEPTGPQQALMPGIELYLTKSMFFEHPWPEDYKKVLCDAIEYAEEVLGVVADAGVMTENFKETALGKLSALRGGPLNKVEYMMEEKYGITTGDDTAITKLMAHNSFLYPTPDRKPTQFCCVGSLCDTVEIMLFRSTKDVGQAFFEKLVSSDDAAECSPWHQKLRDRAACQGVPPALIALAATMRYFRALVALPHLGKLCTDLLAHLKAYYMDRWPASEHDDDDNTPLAW